jgi:sugar lactone lactonase YvrE
MLFTLLFLLVAVGPVSSLDVTSVGGIGYPQDILLDATNNVIYAVTADGSRSTTFLKRISLDGKTICSVATSGSSASTSGCELSLNTKLALYNSALYFTSPARNVICKLNSANGFDLLLNVEEPNDLEFDTTGNIFITQTSLGKVSKITFPASGGNNSSSSVAAVADYITGLNFPANLALDSLGNIYISQNNGGNVLKYDSQGLNSSIIYSDIGLIPHGIALDPLTNRVAIADSNGAGRIIELTPAVGGIAAASSANSTAQDTGYTSVIRTAQQFARFEGVLYDSSSNIIASDPDQNLLLKFSAGAATNTYSLLAVGFGPSSTGSSALAFDPAQKTLVISDYQLLLNLSSTNQPAIYAFGSQFNSFFESPNALHFSPEGKLAYSDFCRTCLGGSITVIGQFSTNSNGSLDKSTLQISSLASSIAVYKDSYYLGFTSGTSLSKVAVSNGSTGLTIVGSGFSAAYLTVDSTEGALYFSGSSDSTVKKLDLATETNMTTLSGDFLAINALEFSGNYLYVLDNTAHKITLLDRKGNIHSQISGLSDVEGLAVDSSSSDNAVIYTINPQSYVVLKIILPLTGAANFTAISSDSCAVSSNPGTGAGQGPAEPGGSGPAASSAAFSLKAASSSALTSMFSFLFAIFALFQ